MPESDSPTAASPSRRRLFRAIVLAPVAAAGGAALVACERRQEAGGPGATAQPAATGPVFFTAKERDAVTAICARLIPADALGPGAVELGVPEFLDRHMQTPYAAGANWYRLGPFLEAPASFGYQGPLALRDILRTGLAALDAHVGRAFAGRTFAGLGPADQDAVLRGAEAGTLKWPEISEKTFFGYLLSEVRNGFGADPIHGGNRDMGGWKAIDYPGVRADYLDWVGVRDRPYPIPPVDMAGRRG